MSNLIILFCGALFSIFYAYFGYPVVIFVSSKLFKKKTVKKANIEPMVSVVVPAYNEVKNIGPKINDLLSLDYPKEKTEICVVSDASSDGTDEIVKGFEGRGVRLLRLANRSGKIAAYKTAVRTLMGEIVVFSDATSILNADSIKKIVANFNDKKVGCVGGFLVYVNPKQALVGKGEKKYWSYEKRVRHWESAVDSLPSVSGTFFAVRKELFPMDLKEDLAEDLIVPIHVRKLGFRTVYEEGAVCKDYTTLTIKEEINKRMRITIQNIRGLVNQIGIFNFFRYGMFSIIVISHKLFRLLVPIFLLMMLVSSVILSKYSLFFSAVFLAQLTFYFGAWAGYGINKKVKFTLGNSLFYFCISNYAILLGILKFLKGEKVITWQTVRA